MTKYQFQKYQLKTWKLQNKHKHIRQKGYRPPTDTLTGGIFKIVFAIKKMQIKTRS